MVRTSKDIDVNSKSTTLGIHSACTLRMLQQTMVLDILRDRTFLEVNFAFYYQIIIRRCHYRKPQGGAGKGSFCLQRKPLEGVEQKVQK